MADRATGIPQSAATTPTTQTAGTDINLNLNFDDIKIPETPATTTDLNIDFSDVTKTEVKVETPEVKVETPEVKVEVPESTSNYTEALPIEEAKPVVVEETPAPAVEAPAAKDDRLAQEDKIVEKTETPIVEEVSVTPGKTTEITTKEFPASSLAEDQKIIDELTSTTKVEEPKVEAQSITSVGTFHETSPSPVVEEIKPVVVAPAVAMDLDSLLGTPNTPATNEVIATPVINQIPVETIPQTIPGSTFQATIPTMANAIITPTIQMTNTAPAMLTPKQHKKSGIKTFAIFAILAGAATYVLATMYPIEKANLIANVMSIFGGDTNITQETGLEGMLEATGTIADTGELLTGSMIEMTGNTASGGIITGDLSTPGFDGFADLQNILTGNSDDAAVTEEQLTQLKKYSDEAKTFLELGKKINDKIMIKYGVYISKKADGFILSIENKEQIDNAKIDTYLAQFSGYLHQLTTLSYNDTTNPTEPAAIEVISEETSTSTSGTNDTSSGLIQDINRDNSEETTPPFPEIPTLPSGATQVPEIPGL